MSSHCCGLDGLRYKAFVSLKIVAGQRPDQGQLTIVRPKIFGGKLNIRLQQDASSLTSIAGKEKRRYQLKIRYGPWHQSVTLRAPTSAIFETWWAALENALASPSFVAIPIVDARAYQVTIAPVLAVRRNTARPRQTTTLMTVMEVECENSLIDDTPMLEANGRSSPTEHDVIASWRTRGGLDYFTTPPDSTSPLIFNDGLQSASDDNADISPFWSRPLEWEDIEPQDDPESIVNSHVHQVNSEVPHYSTKQDKDAWLDELAYHIYQQKVGAA